MRDDVVTARSVFDYSPQQLWQVVGAPEMYSRFIPQISWCEVIEPAEAGRGPRALLRICPQRGVLVEEHITALVYRPRVNVVWCSTRDQQRWLSIELIPQPDGRTELVIDMHLPGLSGRYADLVSPSAVKRELAAVTDRITRHLAGRPPSTADRSRQREDVKATTLGTTSTLVRAGVLSAGRPDKMARQLASLMRWGATVAGAYQAAAARGPNDAALHDERSLRTYGAVDERSNRLGNALSARGVVEGDVVALMCRNHGAMVEAMIACGKIGADVVLLNTGLSASAVAKVISQHRPSVVFADDEFAATIDAAHGHFLRLCTWPDRELGYPTVDELIRTASPEKLTPVERPGKIIVLTSGTTGLPKGARRPTPKGLSTAAALLARIPLRAGDRLLVAAPLFHTWGLAAMQLGMALRASLSLVRKFDPEETLRTIAEHRAQALFAVPIMLHRILDLPERVRDRYDVSSLRIVASSGSALGGTFVSEFMDAFGDKLYNLYGSTEVSWASIADPVDLRAAPTTAGRCPPGTHVAILDGQGRHVPPGLTGEIYVGNEMLFDGYTDGGTLPRAHELMATGDVGYVDADGRLFVTGRADEMIVSGGENVFPRPVEEALLALPEVVDVAVVGVPDEEYGSRLAAYIVRRKGAGLDANGVREYIHRRLARFNVPRDVHFVRDLPRNATGKVLKRLLDEHLWTIVES
jgi:acyl-CoA synthetase (AMP-forming)/AMP-acid ligase II